MDKTFLVALALLAACFAGVYFVNTSNPAEAVFVAPPYYSEVGDAGSFVASFAFVFLFSLLFFGYAAPVALAIEGAKYASFFTVRGLPWFDLLFLLPEVLVCYSAILLGHSALAEFTSSGSLFATWRRAFKYFIVSAVLFGALLIARGYF